MENEIQKRRTYDIIAKYVAEQSKVDIELNDEGKVCADPVNNKISLPRNVKTDNIYPAIAWLIHEASHLKHTRYIDAKRIVDDDVDFHILNACEDVRIDREAFGILPNVIGIYKEMFKILSLKERAKDPSVPIEVKVLSDAILMLEGFDYATSQNALVKGFIWDTGIMNEMDRLCNRLWQIEWNKGSKDHDFVMAKKQVGVIRDILSNIKKNHKPPPQPQPQQQGQSNDKKDSSSNTTAPPPSNDLDLRKLDDTATSGGLCKQVFGDLDKNSINPQVVGSAALHEATETAFKEILNQKETKTVEHGTMLDTDNLLSFFTGDIDDLFKEETTIQRKKSKLLMVLDSSGSMIDRLLDGKSRYHTLAATAKSITNVLDEVHMSEGINVDYGVRRFDHGYYELSKDKWMEEYTGKIGGGTNLCGAFDKAQEELMKDYTIEGKKLIVLITDGEVSNDQIDNIRKSITKHNSDVRAMVLGIGSNVNGSFVKNVSGHNIMTKDLADVVLMEAIQEMME
jgi:hypothetical protein